MSRPSSIQEVLDQLDVIIEKAIVSNNRLGIFAFVYRRTTEEILKEIQLGSFEDNERMERFDVTFANLYLEVHHRYHNSLKTAKSWEFAFAQKDTPLTVLQHIMLGMNAHINLDLAIATSTTMAGKELSDIENDFNRVNDILRNIINEMQDRLSRVSPMLFLLDLIGKNSDEEIIDFSMRKAREQSWNSANLLWALGSGNKNEAIEGIDAVVFALSQRIAFPKSGFVRFMLKSIGKFEKKEVGTIISRLKEN